jgi:undecaprenyl pyrophosphate phosphatase UppP
MYYHTKLSKVLKTYHVQKKPNKKKSTLGLAVIPATWVSVVGGLKFKISLDEVSKTLSQKQAECSGTDQWS